MKAALRRARSGNDGARPVTEVNIIPVIDVSLVLLVILFVTAPLLSVPNTPVELPEAGRPAEEAQTIAVTCLQNGSLSVRSRDIGPGTLTSALAAELRNSPEATVILRVDRRVPFQQVQKLLRAAQAAGATRLAFGAVPKTK